MLQEVYRDGREVPETVPEDARIARAIRARPERAFRTSIEELASRRNLHLFYVPGVRNGSNLIGHEEDRGNAIVSTLPLTEWTAVELPVERHRRVAAVAALQGRTTEGGDWSLLLVSAHLEGRSRTSRFLGSFGRGRERQMRFLLSAVPETRPAVLGADLNTWFQGDREPSVRIARVRFTEPERTPPEATHRLGFLGNKLDYLLFQIPDGWSVETRRLEDRYGSDHHPLLGWVRFAAEEATS
jgi:endonuclease/exonuclease/phosphatase family metal-dependent hydrolase